MLNLVHKAIFKQDSLSLKDRSASGRMDKITPSMIDIPWVFCWKADNANLKFRIDHQGSNKHYLKQSIASTTRELFTMCLTSFFDWYLKLEKG